MIKKKVCLLGAYGVGKTSLVRRYVDDSFSERYLSTIGVNIDKKTLTVGQRQVMMMIWDVAGEEDFFQIPDDYVVGAHGFIFVADGTRPETFATLEKIRVRLQKVAGPLPEVILLNKKDRVDEWQIEDSIEDRYAGEDILCLRTSALDGSNVEAAFQAMAERLCPPSGD